MSDIKMSDVFDLPVRRHYKVIEQQGAIQRGDKESIDAAVRAINTHDAMQARIVELEKTILEVLDDHGDLADGDVCTLIKLKRVVGL